MSDNAVNGAQSSTPLYIQRNDRPLTKNGQFKAAAGEIDKSPKVDSALKQLRYSNAAYAMKKAEGESSRSMAKMQRGNGAGGLTGAIKSAWGSSKVSLGKNVAGVTPQAYGKQAFRETIAGRAGDAVTGAGRLTSSAQAAQETLGVSPGTELEQKDVFKALAHIGRGEVPNKESIGKYFEQRHKDLGQFLDDKYGQQPKLRETYHAKYSDGLDKQQASLEEYSAKSGGKPVDIDASVIPHMAQLDPQASKSFNPGKSLGKLEASTIEGRTQLAMEASFPPKSDQPFPSQVTFNPEKNIPQNASGAQAQSHLDTMSALENGIDKVLKPFPNTSSVPASIAESKITSGIQDSASETMQEAKDLPAQYDRQIHYDEKLEEFNRKTG